MQDSIQNSFIMTFLCTTLKIGGVSSGSLAARGSPLIISFRFRLAQGRYTTYGFFQLILLASAFLKTRGRLKASCTLFFRQRVLYMACFRIIGSTRRPYIRPCTFSLEGSSASYLLLYQLAIGLRICAPYRIYFKGTQQITAFTSCALSMLFLTRPRSRLRTSRSAIYAPYLLAATSI